ncbi:MAG: class II SORL domain-containing protein [Mogibacterium sp.]|nr:class II SORL domain-containing protein [Mogibacterium sp.]
MKFYRCAHCGQIVAIVKKTGVPIICDGDEVVAVYAYCNLHSLWKAE